LLVEAGEKREAALAVEVEELRREAELQAESEMYRLDTAQRVGTAEMGQLQAQAARRAGLAEAEAAEAIGREQALREEVRRLENMLSVKLNSSNFVAEEATRGATDMREALDLERRRGEALEVSSLKLRQRLDEHAAQTLAVEREAESRRRENVKLRAELVQACSARKPAVLITPILSAALFPALLADQ
jgi:hypothetical protein